MGNTFFDRDRFFEKAFNRAFGRVEDYRFRGFNHAFGCFVESKAHYKKLMKERGLVPFEEADRLAEEFDTNNRRQSSYELSPKAQDIIRSVRATADKNGNIKLGNRAINALMEIGAIGNDSQYEPDLCTMHGGFSE